ncbi:MAG: KUP/HAK/KT family potassium transporter [bacterium]
MSRTRTTLFALSLGALGIVFGDIGTSPLYALNVLFGPVGYHLVPSQENIFGIISLLLWSVTLVVSVKFVGFIMRVDNAGEGGIMALVAKIKGSKLPAHSQWIFILLGLVGVSLFYGDITITPAISVLSAVEGLKVVAPGLDSLIIPVTLILLVLLFGIQRYGTSLIGELFGPVMLLWFLTIAAGGGWQIWQHPDILTALLPQTAVNFFLAQPAVAFAALGAVILAITGAEALYADMGHFGKSPITRAWFFVVFPALLLCYMGQGALMLHNTAALSNPLVLLYPTALQLPVVILATLATIIASQSVISGAFSLTRQAVQLNFLPKMLVRHTSTKESGQIYLPFVNGALFLSVVLLVLLFGSSAHLAGAYGIAVSGTLAVDTILYLVVLTASSRTPLQYIILAALAFLPIDLLFVGATLPKIMQGGWFPLAVGALMLTVITTWRKGQRITSAERMTLEGPLQDFVDEIRHMKPALMRAPGTSVYIGHHPGFAPLALRATVQDLHELAEKVIIVTVNVTTESHVPEEERAVFDNLGHNDGIAYVSLTYGYHDVPHVPHALEELSAKDPHNVELKIDAEHASYFVSTSRVVPSRSLNMAGWRKYMYTVMSHNATSSSDYFHLPIERTVEMQSLIPL